MKKEDKAISQILGATLLLLIGLAMLSTVYMYVLTYPLPNPAPYVDIVASIEGNNIVLTHRGGEALDFDTEIRIMIGGIPKNITVGDEDYIDNESKEDGHWGIGERLVYTPTENITNLQVEAIVIDRVTESILMSGVLREGEMAGGEPTVTTGDANVFMFWFADLDMDYDFKDNDSGSVRFAYKWQIAAFWIYTPWTSKSGSGSYTRTIFIIPIFTYEYKAQLRYDSTVIDGETKTFL